MTILIQTFSLERVQEIKGPTFLNSVITYNRLLFRHGKKEKNPIHLFSMFTTVPFSLGTIFFGYFTVKTEFSSLRLKVKF